MYKKNFDLNNIAYENMLNQLSDATQQLTSSNKYMKKEINNYDETRKEYDAINALNYSAMKELLKSPLHYKQFLKNKVDNSNKESKALRIGKMVHEAILQPEVFQRYKPIPDCDKRTKEGKEFFQQFNDSIKPNEITVANDEYNHVLDLSDAVNIALEKKRITFKYTEKIHKAEFNNIKFKCLVDAIGNDDVIYDIKTTDDASIQGFKRSVFAYKYYLQAFIYKSIVGLNDFVFVVVEKEPPFAVAFYSLNEEFMKKASTEFLHAINLYSKSLESGTWEGYSNEIVELDINNKF